MENIINSITIVTITYNCKDLLENTIRSVIAQTYTNKEYIVIDGGSTDNTQIVLEKYNKYIDKCISEPDEGIYDALNKGIKAASNEWIICMNAGDTFTNDKVLEDILSRPISQNISFLYSDFFLIGKDGRKTDRTTDRALGELHHQNVIYRKMLHEQYGFYIVTKPYIVSDLLFFLSIPESECKKIPGHIANVLGGGVSDNLWCLKQSYAAKVIYGIETIPHIFFLYLKASIIHKCKRVLKKLKYNG